VEEAKAQVLHHLCWRRLPHCPLHHCHCLHHIHWINRLVKHDKNTPLRLDQGLYDMVMEQKRGTQPRLVKHDTKSPLRLDHGFALCLACCSMLSTCKAERSACKTFVKSGSV